MGQERNSDAGGRLGDLVRVGPDATLVVDAAGRILVANELAERMLGYTESELRDRPIEILLPERFRGQHVDHRAAYARDSRPRGMGAGLRLFARRKDGRELPVEISLSPLEGRSGVVVAAIRDISERHNMEAALRASEERLRLLIESVREYAIFMLDPEGLVKTWNAGAQRLKGYAASEVVGRHFSIFYPPDEVAAGKPERALAAAVRQGQHREEGWRLRKGGERFRADVTITPLLDPDGVLRGFAKVTGDVTERRRAEEERERAHRARDEVLALLTHDLQNAVNAVSLNAQLLTRVRPQGERELRMHDYGRKVGHAVDAMQRLIHDMLDAQRIEQGSFAIGVQPEPVVPLVEEAIEPLRAVADEKAIRLETHLDPACGLVACDRVRIVQVLHNLVGNAIKFVPAGGHVSVETRPETPGVEFAVADDGPGIPPEHLPHVFERHWQAPSQAVRRGSGLGLFIVKSIVEAHAGTAWVQSAPGAGARFFFTLPGAETP